MIFLSWYFLRYMVENLNSFKFKPFKCRLKHWTGKKCSSLNSSSNAFRATTPLHLPGVLTYSIPHYIVGLAPHFLCFSTAVSDL